MNPLQTLYEKTGINLSFFYDAYDRTLLWHGVATTLELTAWSLAGSLLLGAAVAYLCQSRVRMVRWLALGYTELFRNTPPLVQLFFAFFAMNTLLSGNQAGGATGTFVSPFFWAALVLSLYKGAFNAEAFRAGIGAVPAALLEAADSLGFSRRQVFRQVTLPLALRFALPALLNNCVELVKATAIASAIAVGELTYAATMIWSDRGNVTELMIFLLLAYNLFTAAITFGITRLERQLRIPGYGH